MRTLKKIALVDDDKLFVFLTKKNIEKTEKAEDVKVFENGLKALNFFKENKNKKDVLPDVIFLDLSMPVLDGWQFLEEYTKISDEIAKQITIYVCSSSISHDDIIRAKAISEVSDYIIKPLSTERMLDLL